MKKKIVSKTNTSSTQFLENSQNRVEIMFEQLQGSIRGLADGLLMANEKLDRFQEETTENFEHINKRLHVLEGDVSRLEGKVDRLDGKVDTLEQRVLV